MTWMYICMGNVSILTGLNMPKKLWKYVMLASANNWNLLGEGHYLFWTNFSRAYVKPMKIRVIDFAQKCNPSIKNIFKKKQKETA